MLNHSSLEAAGYSVTEYGRAGSVGQYG